MLEHDMRIAPASIKFDISDGYTGVTSNKRIQIVSENAPKPYIFEVDLQDLANNPKSFETQLEKFTRGVKSKISSPLRLTDYTKDADIGVARFVFDLHQRVKM